MYGRVQMGPLRWWIVSYGHHIAHSFMPSTPAQAQTAPRSILEKMPKWLICVPLALQWCWLGLRHGSLTLPSAANPRITAGGLVGEGKLEYFEQMGPVGRAATAPYV